MFLSNKGKKPRVPVRTYPPRMRAGRSLHTPAVYSELDRCDVVVDVELSSQAEPSAVADAATWERVHCAPFLDAAASTSTLARAFYIPGYSDKRNVFAEYCVVARRA